jgi:hypothetical protein
VVRIVGVQESEERSSVDDERHSGPAAITHRSVLVLGRHPRRADTAVCDPESRATLATEPVRLARDDPPESVGERYPLPASLSLEQC